MAYIEEKEVKDAVGYIGLEVAENLKYAGYNVTLVEAQDQVMQTIDYDMVQMINREMHEKGLNLVLNDSAKEITDSKVILASGKEINAQAVVMAIGVSPENDLATAAGLDVNEVTGAIKVNHHYKTTDPNIYAVGDAIETTCFFTGEKIQLTLAGPAQRQARAAADHAYGRTYRNTGVRLVHLV